MFFNVYFNFLSCNIKKYIFLYLVVRNGYKVVVQVFFDVGMDSNYQMEMGSVLYEVVLFGKIDVV